MDTSVLLAKYDKAKPASDNGSVYSRVVSEIKRSLVFKTSAISLYKKQLQSFIDERKFPVWVKDHQDRNPLHWAADKRNVDGVRFLVSRFGDLIDAPDSQGATPLRVAVEQAVADPSRNEAAVQSEWSEIIRRLRTNQKLSSQFAKDDLGKRIWKFDSLGSDDWVYKILNKRPLIRGATDSSMARRLEPIDIPQSIRQRACEEHEPILLEIFNTEKGSRTGELLNDRPANLYQLVYDKRSSLEEFLQSSRPPKQNARKICKWVHIPANNVSPIFKLLPHIRDYCITVNIKTRNNGFTLVTHPKAVQEPDDIAG